MRFAEGWASPQKRGNSARPKSVELDYVATKSDTNFIIGFGRTDALNIGELIKGWGRRCCGTRQQ